jgi:hypothetical protein
LRTPEVTLRAGSDSEGEDDLLVNGSEIVAVIGP